MPSLPRFFNSLCVAGIKEHLDLSLSWPASEKLCNRPFSELECFNLEPRFLNWGYEQLGGNWVATESI